MSEDKEYAAPRIARWSNEMRIQKVDNGFIITTTQNPMIGIGGNLYNPNTNTFVCKTSDELILFILERMGDKK